MGSTGINISTWKHRQAVTGELLAGALHLSRIPLPSREGSPPHRPPADEPRSTGDCCHGATRAREVGQACGPSKRDLTLPLRLMLGVAVG